MSITSPKHLEVSRRNFLRSCAAGSAVLATGSLWGLAPNAATKGPARLSFSLDQNWLFAGKASSAADEAAFTKVTLPHCVSKLSWENWDADAWQDVWLYRRHFTAPKDFANRRVFVRFDGVMHTADVSINGTPLPTHKGGYLPFTHELTSALKSGDNVLDVKVDARWLPVPPAGSPKGTRQVDYYLPGGITRGASVYAVPQTFISDVFAKPVDVLKPTRRLEVACVVDAVSASKGPFQLEVKLMDGDRLVASAKKSVAIARAGKIDAALTLQNLKDVKLWAPETPHLYNVVTTLFMDNEPLHDYHTRIGFRDASFTIDGFVLNGKRRRFFGLNRHEIFPYTGYAMPPRVMRRDAEIIRKDFNCDIVRCSHYPQTEAFLDACDELGLMVWQEPPGWQYIGDEEFQDLVVQNVGDMIVRDRNHASIVIWGVRVNESADLQPLYRRTTALAKSLDDSRPTSGSMTHSTSWQTDWHEDVFAMDDYHESPTGAVDIIEPLPGIPYMIAEAVGQRTFTKPGFGNLYRRSADVAVQYKQALYHAQAHDRARAWPRMSGVIAWCAFEYGSPNNSHKGVKNPGVADVFRVPKLGATFYQAQVHPSVHPVIAPNFYWDFGPAAPHGPGKDSVVFSNCDRLELFLDGKPHATLQPDRKGYPNLLYPPFFTSLELDGSAHPELRIDGYVGGHLALSRSFSSDASKDQFLLHADDAAIDGDGIDATRIAFQVTDKYGAPRLLGSGDVTFELTGPGVLIGDNTFSLTESGGAGAVWIKSLPNSFGSTVTLKTTHSTLGAKTVHIHTQPDGHVARI